MNALQPCRPLQSRYLPRSLGQRAYQSADLATGSSSSAGSLLRQYAEAESQLSLRERLDVLCRLPSLHPSVHDERLKRLAQEVLAQRHDLPLSSLVEVTKALQQLGLREELEPLVSMATESAHFLSGDVVLSFARTLATAKHLGSEAVQLAVFKLLGEHVLERMFDSAPAELADSLLAIAVFCCSRHHRLPDPALEAPWHPAVFVAAAGCLQRQVHELPAEVLLKCLRAYGLYLSAQMPRTSSGPFLEDATMCPSRELVPSLLDALQHSLHELSGHSLARALHCAHCLEEQRLLPPGHWSTFRQIAASKLEGLQDELSAKDLAYTMQAVVAWNHDLGTKLLNQVLRHVLALTPQDALRCLRAVGQLPERARPPAAMVIITAEVLRGLRGFAPPELCHALQSFARLKAQEPELLQSLGEAFTLKRKIMAPKQLSVAFSSLVRLQLREGPIFGDVVPEIVRDIVGYTHQDLCLCLWAMAKASSKDLRLAARAQRLYREGNNSRSWQPQDVSMLLWSLSRLQWHAHPELMSRLTQHAVMECPKYSDSALLVTSLSLARMNFTQPPVLAPLFRNLYGRLGFLKDNQLALVFVLFSGSGLRDQAILGRMLFETQKRLQHLQGRDFTNVVMACFRSSTPSLMKDVEGLYDELKTAVQERYPGLSPRLKLRIFLAAPTLFDLSQEETVLMAEALLPHLSSMEPAELTRCIVGCARRQLVHEPFLQPVFQALREQREKMSPVDVISCIHAVHVMNFWTPKFRRSLGFMLMEHVKAWRIPAARLRDVLPALHALGYWPRLTGSLQRAVWRIAPEDLKYQVPPPPKKPLDGPQDDAEAQRTGWRRFGLQKIRPGMLRRISREAREAKEAPFLSRKHGLKDLTSNPWEGKRKRKEEERFVESLRQEAAEEAAEEAQAPPPTAVESFIRMARRL